MKILKAGTYGYYDIFVGDGWENHTRVQLKKNKQLVHVDGNKFLPWQMNQLTHFFRNEK